MFDFDLAQHGLAVRFAVSLGVFLVSAIAAIGFGVSGLFLLAVMGDSGELSVSPRTLRSVLSLSAVFVAIGVFGPCVAINIRGTLQSGIFPAMIGFGGAFVCLFAIMCIWGAGK